MRQLLDAVADVGFHALCGLRVEPARLRMRVLCPRLRTRAAWRPAAPTPCRVESPEGLTVAELGVYEGLRANRWGERVRLEQERIAWWPAAMEAISNALGNYL